MSLMTRCLSSLALVMAGALTLPASAQVGVPDAFGLQGFIHTQSGAPFDGAADVEVRIYDAETAGTLLYTESLTDVEVTGSRFSVLVGDGGTFPTGTYASVTELFSQLPEVYVAVAIDGNAELPRQRMMTAAFAFRAKVADTAFGLVCTDCITTGHLSDASVTAAKIGEACADGEVLKSTGDVWGCAADNDTALTAGDGVAIDAGTVSLASAGCAAGQVLKRNAANDGWECANDAGALGSVTSLSAGDGLSASSATGEVTVSLSAPTDTTLGGVFAGQCPNAGDQVVGVDSAGAVICAADADTTYGAATDGGLALTGTDFGISEGGVTSAMVADGTLELADLSDPARAQLLTELVLNRNVGFEQGLSSWADDATNTAASVLIDGSAEPESVFSGGAAVKVAAVSVDTVSRVVTDEAYPVVGGSYIALRYWSKRGDSYLALNGSPANVQLVFWSDASGALEVVDTATQDFADGTDTEFVAGELVASVPAGAQWVTAAMGLNTGNIGSIVFDDVRIVTANPDLARLFVRGSGGTFSGDTTVDAVMNVTDNLNVNGNLNLSGQLSCTDCVGTADLKPGAVQEADILDAAVTSAKIADDAVTSAKIADGTITAADLGANSVDSSELVDGSVDLSHLAANSVDSSKIVNGSIAAADIGNAAVTTAKIQGLAVTNAKLGAAAVDTNKIADAAVTSAKIADGTITDTNISTTANIAATKIAGTAIVANPSGSQTIDGALTVSGTATASGGIKNGFLTSRSFSFSGQSSGGGAIDEVVYSVPSGALYGGKRGYVRWMCHNRGNAASNEVGTRFFIYATDQAGLNPTSIVSGDPSTAVNPRWNGQDLVVTVPQFWNCTIEVSGT